MVYLIFRRYVLVERLCPHLDIELIKFFRFVLLDRIQLFRLFIGQLFGQQFVAKLVIAGVFLFYS
jgi:hypothetical protein